MKRSESDAARSPPPPILRLAKFLYSLILFSEAQPEGPAYISHISPAQNLENGLRKWRIERVLESDFVLPNPFDPFYFLFKPWYLLAMQSRMAFPFENLEVYKQSVQFVSDIHTLLEREGKRMNRSISDQLSRASLSIPLNIAEGNGRWHKAEKRNYFWISRGSCFECVPIIEILRIKSHVTAEEREALRSRLESIGKMLTKLVQAHRD